MDADDVGAEQDAGGHRRRGGPLAGRRLAVADRRLEKRLARRAREDGPVQCRNFFKVGEDLEAVLGAFGEAQARIQDDRAARDAGVPGSTFAISAPWAESRPNFFASPGVTAWVVTPT